MNNCKKRQNPVKKQWWSFPQKKKKKKLMTENLWLFSQKNSILDIWLSSEYASGFITFYHKNLFALEGYLIKDWKIKTCQYKYYFSGNFTQTLYFTQFFLSIIDYPISSTKSFDSIIVTVWHSNYIRIFSILTGCYKISIM